MGERISIVCTIALVLWGRQIHALADVVARARRGGESDRSCVQRCRCTHPAIDDEQAHGSSGQCEARGKDQEVLARHACRPEHAQPAPAGSTRPLDLKAEAETPKPHKDPPRLTSDKDLNQARR